MSGLRRNSQNHSLGCSGGAFSLQSSSTERSRWGNLICGEPQCSARTKTQNGRLALLRQDIKHHTGDSSHPTCPQGQDLSFGCSQKSPNQRRWHLQLGVTALTSSSPINNNRRWEAQSFSWWNNKSSFPRASVRACWHKQAQDVQFLGLQAHPSWKARLPRGVVYHCYQKYSGLFTVSLQQKKCADKDSHKNGLN